MEHTHYLVIGSCLTSFLIMIVFLLQRRTRERLMNVLSLCGPESGIPKNPSVRLLSYSKASDKVSVKSLLKILLLLSFC